jgi:hypothetical protein
MKFYWAKKLHGKDKNGIIPLINLMPLKSAGLIRTKILKVGSEGEIVREIKRI